MIIKTIIIFKDREIVSRVEQLYLLKTNAEIYDLGILLALQGAELTVYPEALVIDTSRNTDAIIGKMKNILTII